MRLELRSEEGVEIASAAEYGAVPARSCGPPTPSPGVLELSLQIWQSVSLAARATVACAIYLRQRGSSESKPVGVPHHVSAERPRTVPRPHRATRQDRAMTRRVRAESHRPRTLICQPPTTTGPSPA
ncbi:DUF6766 family protein [Microbacterium sp. NPDC058062]|uniref:DUF6766 family protein n=1 Tax=Microbacterium sp. NPDC058062 TaxID=3346320 RepID=UPI0036D868B3